MTVEIYVCKRSINEISVLWNENTQTIFLFFTIYLFLFKLQLKPILAFFFSLIALHNNIYRTRQFLFTTSGVDYEACMIV